MGLHCSLTKTENTEHDHLLSRGDLNDHNRWKNLILLSLILLTSADPLKQAEIDEAIADAKAMKYMYFPMTKLGGRPESAEGLKEVEDSMQALNDLRFKVRSKYTQ